MTLNEDGTPAFIREREYGSGGLSEGPIDWDRFHPSNDGQVEYQFNYSGTGKVTQIFIREAGEIGSGRYETMVRNDYDQGDRLIRQTVEERYIYKTDHRYRRMQYANDTTVLVYSVTYSANGGIEHLTRGTKTTCCDTLYRDIRLEQLFPSSPIVSAGRDTVEVVIPHGSAKLIDGTCVATPSNMVWRYIHLDGRIVSRERVDKVTGHIYEQWTTTYLDNGLYDATRYQSGAPFWKAEYVLRE